MLIRVYTVGTPVATATARSHLIARGYLVVGALLMVAAAAVADSGRSAAYVVAVGLVIPAIIIGHRVHQAGRALSIPMAITVVAFLVAEILPGVSALQGRGEVVDSLIGLPTVLGHLAFIGCLLSIVRLRHGRHLWSLMGDATIVAIGAWLVSWVTMIRPALDSSSEAASATLIHGLSQPLGVVMVFLLVMLLLADTFRTPAVWLIGAASASMLAGDVGYAATAAGHISGGSRVFDMFYMGSFLLAGALFLHPACDHCMRRSPWGLREDQPAESS